MQVQHSVQPSPRARFGPVVAEVAASALHTPRNNRLLAALPLADYASLLPHLEPVPLLRGQNLHHAGDRYSYLYFVAAGIVSRFHVLENGAPGAFAVTGNDGVIGVALFMGGQSTPGEAMVLSAGYGYRLGAGVLQAETERNGPLLHVLLRYTQLLITQYGQTAACNRYHSVEQQLCRLILACLDRLPSNEVAMTQELIADILGVRREAVTAAAGRLKSVGLIDYSRGHIEVLDRARLEVRACECYSVVKREYDRLLPPANS